jgi:hypothetical protein
MAKDAEENALIAGIRELAVKDEPE